MTIPHADLIRAVLDGKTVQWRNNKQWGAIWLDYQSPSVAIQDMAADVDPDCAFRLKPEPRCVWALFYADGMPSGTYESQPMRPQDWRGTMLRHEFDPDTGEYLRTVKEEA